MLVKVNDVNSNKVKVTKLDIDNYGSVIPIEELEINLPTDDDLIIQILKRSPYAAIFTKWDNDNNNTIILASGRTLDELNEEKNKIINTLNKES